MAIPSVGMAALFLGLSACGGRVLFDDDGTGGSGGATSSGASGATTGTSTPGVTQTCLDYCDAVVTASGCFGLAHCHQGCMALYAPGCEEQVEAMLRCLPEWLSDECQILYDEDPPYGCGTLIDQVQGCAYAVTDCEPGGSELVPAVGCVGRGICGSLDYEVACDDDARCACRLGGELVGECAMPFTGVEPCDGSFGCCRAFFDG